MKIIGIVLSFLLLFSSVSFSDDDDCKLEVVKKVEVVYPELAKKAGIEGTVWVELTVEKDGFVSIIVIKKSDNEILNNAAADAAFKYQFKPLLKKCTVTMPFKFKLAK